MEGFSLLGEGTHEVRRVIRKGVMAQKGGQGPLTKQHTNFLGEKALEPLESSEKHKRSIQSEPYFSHLPNRNNGPYSVYSPKTRSWRLAFVESGCPVLVHCGCSNLSEKKLHKYGLMKRTGKQ